MLTLVYMTGLLLVGGSCAIDGDVPLGFCLIGAGLISYASMIALVRVR